MAGTAAHVSHHNLGRVLAPWGLLTATVVVAREVDLRQRGIQRDDNLSRIVCHAAGLGAHPVDDARACRTQPVDQDSADSAVPDDRKVRHLHIVGRHCR